MQAELKTEEDGYRRLATALDEDEIGALSRRAFESLLAHGAHSPEVGAGFEIDDLDGGLGTGQPFHHQVEELVVTGDLEPIGLGAWNRLHKPRQTRFGGT